jgi:hypothetical protein
MNKAVCKDKKKEKFGAAFFVCGQFQAGRHCGDTD